MRTIRLVAWFPAGLGGLDAGSQLSGVDVYSGVSRRFGFRFAMGLLMNLTARATSSVNKVCQMECSQMDGFDQCVSVIA